MKGLPGSSALIGSARTAAPTTPAAVAWMNERRFMDRSALSLLCRLIVFPLSLFLLSEVGDQVNKNMGLEVLLQPVGHGGLARARQLLQVGPQDDLSLSGRTDQGDAAAALLGEDAREYLPLSGDCCVIEVTGLDGPAGVEQGGQEPLRRLIAHGGQVGADRPLTPTPLPRGERGRQEGAVAGGAVLREQRQPPAGIALQLQRRLIGEDHLVSVGVD